MHSHEKHTAYRIMYVIAHSKLAAKAARMFSESGLPIHYTINGEGTVSSEMMDVLGMINVEKQILMSVMPKCFAEDILRKLRRELKFGIPNSGIAFTLPLSGANSLIIKMIDGLEGELHHEYHEKKGEMTMSDAKYVMITAVVNQGYSEEVMEAARSAGATGGTVIRSRRVATDETISFWGLSVQAEKDVVMIVTETEKKLAIMKAIGEKCGVHTRTRGIVVSMPIDSAIGIGEYD